MRVAVFSRALVPSHFFRGKVLAWQCSVCRKLFCRTVEEVDHDDGNNLPVYIESEFRLHDCELALVVRQEQHDSQRTPRVLVEFQDRTGFDRQRGER